MMASPGPPNGKSCEGLTSCTVIDSDGKPCNHCGKLEDVEAQLVEAENLVANLTIQRTALKSSVNGVHDRIIGRVPPEIAAHIFQIYVEMHAAPTTETGVFPYENVMTVAPLRLGAVCSKWRRIAWSAPQLWTTLAIDIFTRGHKSVPLLAFQWLDRTGSLPLSIHLFTSHTHDSTCSPVDEMEDARSLTTIIGLFSDRWQSLNLDIPSDIMMHILDTNGVEGNQAPSILKHLRLQSTEDPSNSAVGFNVALSPKHAPTHVQLSFLRLSDFTVKWTNLIDLDAGYLSVDEYFAIFRQAPQLEKCNLYAIQGFDQGGPLHSPIVNPTLHSLSVSEMESEESALANLLDGMTLPSLQKFSYYGDEYDSLHMPTTSLVSLIGRSHCQITWIHLGGPVIVDEELIRILEAAPSLKELSLILGPDNNIGCIFEQLSKTTDDAGHSFLPTLEELRIRACRHFSWNTLPDIFDPGQLHSTQVSGTQSNVLQRQLLQLSLDLTGEITESDYVDKQTLRRIRKLIVKSGVDLSIGQKQENENEDESFTYVDLIKKSFLFHFSNKKSSGNI